MKKPVSARPFPVARYFTVALSILASIATLDTAAQGKFPTRAITIVVPYPPGGSNDNFARAVGKRLSEALQQSVIIDNRPGAGGSIGTAFVAKSANDGYTLAAVSSSFATNAAIQPNLPFDAIKNFAPVAMMANGPFVIAVKNDLPVKSFADFIALAKAQPGKLNYASSGPGSINQFATELLKSAAGIEIAHVPYKGMSPATMDLMGGHVDVLIASGPSLLPSIRAGKVRGIGITSPGISAIAPDLAPVAGTVAGYSFALWWGVLAPAGTPPEVVNRLNAEINKILATTEMKEFFLREGAESAIVSPAQFSTPIASDIARYQQIAKRASITLD